ncbi:maltose alpha-D-glucosyltransferase [Rhizosaccharibacter radicis]|uniref:Maltokinase n=1 Tax=Rhizosaccharibacter radicis TaxID=2782605 RepID=A0ABT1VWB7_9PROT|nr:maltose alpha-D-glucosyltransferase [Acetobacteraceae bacterium KSS12]
MDTAPQISIPTPPPIEDPLWYKDAVIYQLHLKSFFDANNDGVGDFEGLLQKLDYIVELGVTAIWMLPFYPSPRRDDGYDISDYRGVHPDYGTLNDLRRFVVAAHERGLRVITELVINHTSDQHSWFQRARKAPPGSPERDFYVWSDTDTKYAGTRIIFCDTEKSNWTWDEEAKAYYWHRFYSHQPDLNFDNPAVMEEVLSAMRFWLDMGIDGLRLDAIPYLIERDGTSNENLDETHQVIKRIRAELDVHAPGRMLLAEANMWPEDAQAYFGDGDECHMSFHFPLMPRMYMAIAREDRFPITDIMRQTPEIPANCQWAVFLRNHDELTLEMVTSSERDYLWETYASDKRARINLGIRRRLAPLMQRDRRRVELMNGLLLSMPGTPVIYYGDEIGMGDNIHLGDRDGVRTPMQWSVDRNGGFSRADPASMVLPPIMDPIYGFQAVNVEAQASDPHSLLNWTRRMLAVRKRHQAFGRGVLRFLYPGNRKVLAYLRDHTNEAGERETILCVYNLSRAAQATELELHEFEGYVPVDAVGGSIFPPIGQLTYLLTLPPYGFYWFVLAAEQSLPAWHTPSPEPLPDLRTIVVRDNLGELGQGRPRLVLEAEALPNYLPKRRWFSAKNERLQGVTLAYAVPLTPDRDNLVVLAEVEATLPDRTERYCLPIAAVAEGNAIPLAQQLALSRVRRGPLVGYLTDAFASDRFIENVLPLIRDGAEMALPDGGRLVFRPTSRFPALDGIDLSNIRRLSAEQSNSSLIVDDTLVLKIVRKVLSGIHPEAEISRHLTEAGYANSPPMFGEVTRIDADGKPNTLIVVQGFVRNQGDGWSWTLDYLSRAAQDLETVQVTDGQDAVREAYRNYSSFASALGRRLAQLHEVFSAPSDDPAFSPATVNEADLAVWADGVVEQIEGAVSAVERLDPAVLSETTRAQIDILLQQREALHAAARRLASEAGGALSTRVHGDFHLGQVLVVAGDAYLIDFEGEPAKTMEQRRAHSSPIRDVAGMLRSFDYAGATAASRLHSGTDRSNERREQLLAQFRRDADADFLAAYREVLHASAHPWVRPESEQALLDLFLLEKASYEVRYEASNRPDWIGIPLGGLVRIATRLLGLPSPEEPGAVETSPGSDG